MRGSGCRRKRIVRCGPLMAGLAARAQEPTPPGQEPAPPGGSEPAPPGGSEPAPPGGEPTPPTGNEPPPGEAAPEKPQAGAQLGSLSWKDILTVPRRPILKYHRVELIPTYNVTVNNTLYRHHGFGGIINFF